jgi:hypothetical protein
MADEKKTVALVHEDKGASFTHSDGTQYAADKKTGLFEVAPEHVADALSHGFSAPKAQEKSK